MKEIRKVTYLGNKDEESPITMRRNSRPMESKKTQEQDEKVLHTIIQA